ncbi:hypothetical protein CONPUDRAFT_48474 [Coniophora puteana RWD-64-598 SS2]|uniref:Uncharacterized protein n=1 Tax=Coniophora puteana (strain RWD-64-598) TaxID=741705 RepID=A0A5M3N0A4_CONPW|nr:uncharacterized protein CONPUDRAFT_48474 [Coniophora puteana RWD-64-598 SS2]EIW84798.1 hypothetical protein CONPUDRAFT_48474 [Coniophora puteana RWD-64-598 SS2]
MVCLNLPPHLRYKLENVYLVGIMPGPHEPSLDQINHFLRPLVTDLLRLYKHGIYLKRTYLYPAGRLIRVALGPLICDLLAARKTAGFAGHRANLFCSFCQLPLSDIADLSKASWTRRTAEQHRLDAIRWAEAPSENARQVALKRRGARWSELLHLPYWDVVRYTVVDAMHNLFLGMVSKSTQGLST